MKNENTQETKLDDLVPSSIISFDSKTNSLLFTTSFTVTNSKKSLAEVLSKKENLEALIGHLGLATPTYLSFINDNIKNGQLPEIIMSLTKKK